MVIGMVAERFMLQAPVLADDLPMEMMFIRKIAGKEMDAEGLKKGKLELSFAELPSALLRAVARHDALADILLSPETPTERQRVFIDPPFDGYIDADTIVAAYISHTYRIQLTEKWTSAYSALPVSMRDYFEDLLQNSPGGAIES